MDLKVLLRIPLSETASQLTKFINLVQLRTFRLQLSHTPLVILISDPVLWIVECLFPIKGSDDRLHNNVSSVNLNYSIMKCNCPALSFRTDRLRLCWAVYDLSFFIPGLFELKVNYL